MRQRRATWAIAAVSVVLVGALIAFGCERSAEPHHEEAMEEAEGGHMMEGEHHHAESPEAQGAHMEEPAGEHHGEMDEAVHHEAADEHEHRTETEMMQGPAQPEPSGKVVEDVRVVKVTARQFEFEPATIVVLQGEKVRLEVTSEDVTHGMGIEAYDINETLPPGESKKIEFTADEAGTHHFHCTVYCGKGHNDMHGELIVLEESE